jgi:hypothetical protein
LWSNGKKNDPALLASPLLTLQLDLTRTRGQFPLGELLVTRRDRHASLLAFGTAGRLFLRRPHLAIGSGMFLQQKASQLMAQKTS